MGVLNKRKSGAAGAPAGAEFFSTAEASQLNTLLRRGGPETSAGEVVGSGSALDSGEAPSEGAQVHASFQTINTPALPLMDISFPDARKRRPFKPCARNDGLKKKKKCGARNLGDTHSGDSQQQRCMGD